MNFDHGRSVRGPKSCAVTNGTNNNLAIGEGETIILDVTDGTHPNADFYISGIAVPVSGRRITIWNNTGYIAKFLHNDSNSSAANRIFLSGAYNSNYVDGTYVPIPDKLFIELVYLNSYWRVISTSLD